MNADELDAQRKEITERVLASFLVLGMKENGDTGSYALAEAKASLEESAARRRCFWEQLGAAVEQICGSEDDWVWTARLLRRCGRSRSRRVQRPHGKPPRGLYSANYDLAAAQAHAK